MSSFVPYGRIGSLYVPQSSELWKDQVRIAEANRAWLNEVTPVLFGCYAWLEGVVQEKIEFAGSGIFVAPRFCLGAKHVSASFEKFDDQFDALYRRRTVLDDPYMTRIVDGTKFSTLLYQVDPNQIRKEWACSVDWASPDTDVTTMQVVPQTPGAEEAEKTMQFYEWQMLPPPIGADVRVIGLPPKEIKNDGRDHYIDLFIHSEPAKVVEVYPVRRECGMWNFPGFRLNIELEHGMSGAPVFYDGALVGMFSGPDYVASLWPLALHTYRDREGNTYSMADQFDSGEIKVRDWDLVTGKVVRKPCAEATAGSEEGPCSKNHVVLLP